VQNIFFLHTTCIIFRTSSSSLQFSFWENCAINLRSTLISIWKKRSLVNANAGNRNVLYKIWNLPIFWGACNGARFTVRPYRGQQWSTASGDAAVKVIWELYHLTQWQLVIEHQATSEHFYSWTALTVFSLVLTACTNWRDISRTLKFLNFALSLRFFIWTTIVFLVCTMKTEFVLCELDADCLCTL
jgi:hypothetical protein